MGSPSQTRNPTYRWPASKSTMASVRTPDGSPRCGSYWMKPVAIAAPFHSSSPITPSITGGIAVRTATISFEFDVGTVFCAPAAAVQIRNAMAANPSRLRTAPYLMKMFSQQPPRYGASILIALGSVRCCAGIHKSIVENAISCDDFHFSPWKKSFPLLEFGNPAQQKRFPPLDFANPPRENTFPPLNLTTPARERRFPSLDFTNPARGKRFPPRDLANPMQEKRFPVLNLVNPARESDLQHWISQIHHGKSEFHRWVFTIPAQEERFPPRDFANPVAQKRFPALDFANPPR